MSKFGDEISRFHSNGKTFFFNKLEARNGNEYLSINTIWGNGNQERVVVFPEQMVSFYNGLKASIAEITGLAPEEGGVAPEPAREIVNECPSCGSGPEAWGVRTKREGPEYQKRIVHWDLVCNECMTRVLEGGEDVGE